MINLERIKCNLNYITWINTYTVMKKKKSTGKKKGKKTTQEKPTTAGEGNETEADPADPETMVGGKKAKKGKTGKKGKKGKRKAKGKLTLAEKRLEKLEKACDALREDSDFF